MKPLFTRTIIALIALTVAGAVKAQAPATEIEQLKAAMQVMQKNMEDMQRKLADLEKAKATPAAAPAAVPGAVTFDTPPTPIVAKASPVADRDNFNNQQEQAPRLDDLVLDPKYNGYIPIPNTQILVKFNAKPRVDMFLDNRNSGNNDRFVTATIPMEGSAGYDSGSVFNATTKGSSLSADMTAPNLPGHPRFVYNNDFFGSGGGMAYRLKQLYGSIYNFTAGFTFSPFEDPDMWPDTVDFEGPNSAIFARQPVARYMVDLGSQWVMNVGLEQPSTEIDTTNTSASGINHAPDFAFNFRWEDAKAGHIQLSGVLRQLGANGTALGNQTVTGWGIGAAASFNVFEKDSVQLQAIYGPGIFHFANDNFSYSGFAGGDAAFDSHGKLQALDYTAYLFGFTHKWNDEWRSTITYGNVHLGNEFSQSGAAYHQTDYASANFVWQMRKRLSVGFEVLYGKKVEKSNAQGEVWRVQTGMVYSIF